MLFLVEMEVCIPHNADPAMIERLKAEEKARAETLQRAGV
jgi:muconolactone D-isomerase